MSLARLVPAAPPYEDEVAAILSTMMPPGREPLALFRTIAHNPRILARFRAGALIDRGSLTLRQREIVIDRTMARLGCDYEWGVHVAFFADRAGFGAEEIASLLSLDAGAANWSEPERALLAAVDELCGEATWSDPVHGALARHFSPAQILEVIALAGFYHTVAFYANALRIEPESWAARPPEGCLRRRRRGD